MKNLQCKLTRKRWLEIGVSALLFVLIVFGVYGSLYASTQFIYFQF